MGVGLWPLCLYPNVIIFLCNVAVSNANVIDGNRLLRNRYD